MNCPAREKKCWHWSLLARAMPKSQKALTLSLSTVGFHVSNIIGKLGASNRTEAVSLARKYHLLPHDITS